MTMLNKTITIMSSAINVALISCSGVIAIDARGSGGAGKRRCRVFIFATAERPKSTTSRQCLLPPSQRRRAAWASDCMHTDPHSSLWSSLVRFDPNVNPSNRCRPRPSDPPQTSPELISSSTRYICQYPTKPFPHHHALWLHMVARAAGWCILMRDASKIIILFNM